MPNHTPIDKLLAQALMNKPVAPQYDEQSVNLQLAQALNRQNRAQDLMIPQSIPRGQAGFGTAAAAALRPIAGRRHQKKAEASLADALGKRGGISKYKQQMEQFNAEIARIKSLQDFQTKEGMKDKSTSAMRNAEAQGLQRGTPEYNKYIQSQGKGVTVNTGDTPENAQHAANIAAIKTRTQNAVAENQKLMEQGAEARKTIPSYNMGLKLLESVKTGPITEQINYAKKLANSLGIDVDLNQVANYEQLAPIFGQFLFQGIQQTKGSVSNKEMEIFQKMNANYEYTTEGNRRLLTFAKNRAERDVKIRDIVRNSRKQGKSPAEISEAVDRYIDENDMSDILVSLVTGGDTNADDELLQKYLD